MPEGAPHPAGHAVTLASQAFAGWRERLAFQSILETTADRAGEDFLRHLVRQLCQALGTSHAFVAEFAGSRDRVRTVGFWGGDDWLENVEYDLSGTPCFDVVDRGFCLCPDDVQRHYPRDAVLQEMGARSYLGVALSSPEDGAIGHLAVIDDKPMSDDPGGLAILQLFAKRARIELERIRAEHLLRETLDELRGELEHHTIAMAHSSQALGLAYEELAALLRMNHAVSRGLDRDELFAALAGSLSALVPTGRFGIEMPLGPDRLQGHLLAPVDGVLPERTEPHEIPTAGTACAWVLERGERLVLSSLAQVAERFPATHAVMAAEGMESLCVLPLVGSAGCRAVLFFMAAERAAYQGLRRGLLDELAGAVAVALDNTLAHESLRALRDQLAAENQYLQEEIRHEHNFDEIVGRSDALQNTLGQVLLVAPTDATVLIQGETGSGKELVARAIHARSARSTRPLIKVNCAAIPAGLVESELFGHEKGAFTGATQRRIGRFELADGGTLFLDEVGELPPEAQVKLLRVLQEQEFERVGGSQTRRVDVRVIAATNRDLAREVEAGRFRQDLFYRLSVFPLPLPPLRERGDDVQLLAQFFLDRTAPRIGRAARRIEPAGLALLAAHAWPGNVRELANAIERALILCPPAAPELGAALLAQVLPGSPAWTPRAAAPGAEAATAGPAQSETLADLQRRHLEDTLRACGGRIEGARGAAHALGLSPSTLRSLMKRLGVRRQIPAA